MTDYKYLPKITDSVMEHARAKGAYIRLDKTDKPTPASLGGAEKLWQKHPDYLYLPGVQVVGPRAVLVQFLHDRAPTYSAEEYLQTAFSFQNTRPGAPMHQAFLDELKTQKEQRAHVAKTAERSTSHSLSVLAVLAEQSSKEQSAPEKPKAKSKKAAAAAAKPAKGKVLKVAKPAKAAAKRHVKPLLERVQELLKAGGDKVIDVSRMTADGTDARTRSRPGKGSDVFGPEGVPIVSSDKAKFEMAMAMLGPGYERYTREWENMLESRTRSTLPPPVARSPVRPAAPAAAAPRVPSPRSATPARLLPKSGRSFQ